MSRYGGVSIALVAGILAFAAQVSAKPAVAGKTQQPEQWLRSVIPLPKEASIPEQVTLAASDVRLVLHGGGELEQNALRRLQSLFVEKAGVSGEKGGAFEIVLGVCDSQGRIAETPVPDAVRLHELPNREQAYLIRPVAQNRLILAALNGRGLFYAALTLRQLLEARFKGDDVSVPLAVITDWPDMAERGEWGCSSTRDIEWMADRKMNLVEFHTTHSVDPQGKPVTGISEALLRRGRINAVTMAPIISHLNSVGSRGAYTAFPEMRGKGKTAVVKTESGELHAPCASHPKLREVLAGWMCGFAAHEGVRDVSCWLGELNQFCGCEECAKTGQFALETRAFVEAWRQARKQYADLRIRILLTQGSYNTNEQVLAEVPPEVGVTYYDGGKTYDSSPQPMIYPLLEDYAAKGRWLGCYPQLTPSWRIVSPWSCPQFIKFRMTEFVDKKVVSLGGYVVPDNRLYDFNVTAAAEWSWNAHGRSEKEFALAWATRQGFAHPDAVAEWAVTLGPVAWDLYGARFVERYLFNPGSIGVMVSSRSKPVFGKGMLALLKDEDHLRRNRQTCVDALRLANQSGSSAIVAESTAILTYYDMVAEICGLCNILSARGAIGMPERRALQEGMNRLALAGGLNMTALRDWERAVEVGAGGGRFREGVQATGDTVQAVAAALKRHGVRNSAGVITNYQIGAWSSEDFTQNPAIVKEFDVTDYLTGPGAYTVSFQYTSGWNGLSMSRVALAACPKDKPNEKVELSADQHQGSTGATSKGNVYFLKLDAHEAGRRYLVAAAIRGTRPQDQQPGRTGCNGVVQLQRQLEPDWQIRIMSVQPHSDTEMPEGLKTKFTGKGIRVGVVTGGYGSDGLARFLEKEKGIDALALPPGELCADRCQVIILPQFRTDMAPASLPKELESFVRAGGGLITTHDAVGYRDMPPVLTSVCKGGTAHVRHESWVVSGEHPLTSGLARKGPLTQGYYDHIQLESGPEGAAVAVSEKSGKPVVVAGEFGKGRYVACGLLMGLSADNQESPPTPDEARLLLNAIRWCSRTP